MSEPIRVPMQRRTRTWIGEDDVSCRFDPPLTGRRFSMDVSEVALAQFGARAIEAAVEQLGSHVVYEHMADIQRAVDAVLLDRKWLEPIIEGVVRQAALEFMHEMLSGGAVPPRKG